MKRAMTSSGFSKRLLKKCVLCMYACFGWLCLSLTVLTLYPQYSLSKSALENGFPFNLSDQLMWSRTKDMFNVSIRWRLATHSCWCDLSNRILPLSVTDKVQLQHRESWQNLNSILNSKSEVTSFSLEVSKQLGMRYVAPPLPVDLHMKDNSTKATVPS